MPSRGVGKRGGACPSGPSWPLAGGLSFAAVSLLGVRFGSAPWQAGLGGSDGAERPSLVSRDPGARVQDAGAGEAPVGWFCFCPGTGCAASSACQHRESLSGLSGPQDAPQRPLDLVRVQQKCQLRQKPGCPLWSGGGLLPRRQPALPAPGGPGRALRGPVTPRRLSGEHITCSLSGSFSALGFLPRFSLPVSQTILTKGVFPCLSVPAAGLSSLHCTVPRVRVG